MFRELLRSEYQPWGELSALQLDQLERHHQLLESWNRRLNLTRIEDISEVVRFHYCESLFVSTVLPAGRLSICDLGSGAGFPGIPLAVIRPDLEVVLIESDQRKAVFLREATRDLRNAQVFAARYQECTIEFDWAVSRAVSLGDLSTARLAPSIALLQSTASIPSLATSENSRAIGPRSMVAPLGADVIRLPWGRDRVLVVSRGTPVLPAAVPRETFS
jgi:16S rRNA (guanine527-N7)-methyltransferase